MNFHHIAIPVLFATVALLILGEFRENRRLIYVFKPVSTLLIIAIAALGWRTSGDGMYGAVIFAGLVLSLGGDISLMPPDTPFRFRTGLILFLAAHIAYIAAFWSLGTWSTPDILVAIALAAIGFLYYRLLRPRLGAMALPVAAYILIISLMLSRAASPLFIKGFDAGRARLVFSGALLFYASDLVLSANRFWKPWRYHRLSLALYFGGQLLIALSVAG